jgi:hypothetical protein
MKAIKITYWVSTALVSIMMAYSAYSYVTNPAMQLAFVHLGYPDYFRKALAFGKFIGVALLLLPVDARIKEWVYAGFGITFISAFIAHTVSGDSTQYRLMPVIFLTVLLVSYFTYHKSQKAA